MIGDAKAGNKAPKAKRPSKHGKSFRNIEKANVGDSGSSKEVDKPAERATKGMKAGPGSRDKQNPREQRARKIEAWCCGTSRNYK